MYYLSLSIVLLYQVTNYPILNSLLTNQLSFIPRVFCLANLNCLSNALSSRALINPRKEPEAFSEAALQSSPLLLAIAPVLSSLFPPHRLATRRNTVPLLQFASESDFLPSLVRLLMQPLCRSTGSVLTNVRLSDEENLVLGQCTQKAYNVALKKGEVCCDRDSTLKILEICPLPPNPGNPWKKCRSTNQPPVISGSTLENIKVVLAIIFEPDTETSSSIQLKLVQVEFLSNKRFCCVFSCNQFNQAVGVVVAPVDNQEYKPNWDELQFIDGNYHEVTPVRRLPASYLTDLYTVLGLEN